MVPRRPTTGDAGVNEPSAEAQFYNEFYGWFEKGGCSFWSESNAPDELACIAVKLSKKFVEEAVNKPEVNNFMRGVVLEAQQQRERWGDAHDRDKSAENWYWLIGYLAGKALRA